MARDHGRIKWAIWSDADFCGLREAEQRLFMMLLSQAGLSYAGVVPYTIKRWQSLATDSTLPKLRRGLRALESARFVVVDDDAEELLIRSFIRNDGLLDSPNICRAFVRDFAAICSPLLRAVALCEVARLMDDRPGSEKSWDEVLIPWLSDTLTRAFGGTFTGTFAEGFCRTLSYPQMRTLESVEKATLARTFHPARVAPTPSITPSPRRGGPGSAQGFCEVHRQDEPCRGCAADRKAIRR